MSQYIEWVYGPESEAYNQLISRAIDNALSFEKISAPVEVSVMIVDDGEMRAINKEQRDKDMTTDVLSFPMIEFEFACLGINDLVLGEPMHPETGEHYLGDVVISWNKVVEQSQAYGHSIERELAFLVVHSMLHLMGYDHMVEAEELIMLAKQKEILGLMGLNR